MKKRKNVYITGIVTLFIIIGIPIVIANIITIIIKYLDNFFIYISPLSITMFLSHSNIIH